MRSAIGSIWTKSALSIICTICKMCYLQSWVCTIFTIRLKCRVRTKCIKCRLHSWLLPLCIIHKQHNMNGSQSVHNVQIAVWGEPWLSASSARRALSQTQLSALGLAPRAISSAPRTISARRPHWRLGNLFTYSYIHIFVNFVKCCWHLSEGFVSGNWIIYVTSLE